MTRQKTILEDNEVIPVLIERMERSIVGDYPHQMIIDQIVRIGNQRNDIRDLVQAWARRNLEPQDYNSFFGFTPRSSREWGGRS
ncbi:MAG: hypothetical protein WCK53_13015 [Methanomicrobiales archaeon]